MASEEYQQTESTDRLRKRAAMQGLNWEIVVRVMSPKRAYYRVERLAVGVGTTTRPIPALVFIGATVAECKCIIERASAR